MQCHKLQLVISFDAERVLQQVIEECGIKMSSEVELCAVLQRHQIRWLVILRPKIRSLCKLLLNEDFPFYDDFINYVQLQQPLTTR